MIVIVAHRRDQVAHTLIARWAADGARLLTCSDLSAPGWRHFSDTRRGSYGVVGGSVIALEEITGVFTRIPCVFEQEVGALAPTDRAYAAAEMTAFLLAWLSALSCPVLNRPVPPCLAGPTWHPERWAATAARLGMSVSPVCRSATLLAQVNPEKPEGAGTPSSAHVTVVGKRCIGAVHASLTAQAHLLAQAAGVDLLAVHFSHADPGAMFLRADSWPDITGDPEVECAVREYLLGNDYPATDEKEVHYDLTLGRTR